MSEKINEELGLWWLSSKPEKKVAGTLFMDNIHQIRIDLLGYLGNSETTSAANLIILGISRNGKIFTLMTISPRDYSNFNKFGKTQSIYIDYVFVGKHFEEAADICFDSFYINYTDIEEWINYFPYTLQVDSNDMLHLPFLEDNYPYINIEKIDTLLGLECSFSRKMLDKNKTLSIFNAIYFYLKPQTAQNYVWYLEKFKCIQLLLTLLLGHPIHPFDMKGIDKKEEVKLYYSTPYSYVANIKNSIKWNNGRISYQDIKINFKNIVNAWFSDQEKIQLTLSYYMATIYISRMYIENSFLNLMQAIESYHKKCIGEGKFLKNNDLENSIGKIRYPDDLPIALREVVVQLLRTKNTIPLKERIRQVLNKITPSILDEIGIVSTEKENFIHRIVSARNHLNHDNSSDIDLNQMLDDIIFLKKIIRTLLLEKIGVKASIIQTAFKQLT